MEPNAIARILLGLRALGLTEKTINDLMLYMATGEEHYREALRSAGEL